MRSADVCSLLGKNHHCQHWAKHFAHTIRLPNETEKTSADINKFIMPRMFAYVFNNIMNIVIPLETPLAPKLAK